MVRSTCDLNKAVTNGMISADRDLPDPTDGTIFENNGFTNMEAKGSYQAVYHFLDDNLFETFMAHVSHAQLRAQLRSNEPLRNRCFPGSRITTTLPTDKQLVLAYRREVVERSNGKLASELCAQWVRNNSVLVDIGLRSLGAGAVDAADATSWIEDVHTRLHESDGDERIRGLANTLAGQFPDSEIMIFISIISHGLNQEHVRTLVEQELAAVVHDPQIQREGIERELTAAMAAIGELDRLRGELEGRLKSELSEAHTELANLQQEHGQAEERLSKNDKSISELTAQIEKSKADLQHQQREREAAKKQKTVLSKAISRQHVTLLKSKASIEERLQEVTLSTKQEAARTEQLQSRLRGIEEKILEAKSKELILATLTAGVESQPVFATPKPTVLPHAPELNAVPRQRSSDGVGNNAVCYHGIQRIFRNAVVSFLRERLSRLFPDDHVNRLKKLFGDDWVKAAQNANLSRDNLGTTTTVRDDYDLLGTNHFFNIFDRLYDRLFTPEAGQPPSLPKPVKARFLGNVKAIKDCRDPLSHPVEEEVSFEEAHHLLYSAQEVLKWLGCKTQAMELATLASQLGGNESEDTTLLRRLPSEDSIYLDFVGRNVLLRDLTECFANSDNKRCVLAGDGGKGKSAAALRFVQSLPNAGGRFQLIIWLSAKKRRFREGVPTTVESPDFTTANDATDRLLTEYGATAEDMYGSVADKKRLLFEYLNAFPAFIIADDIDTVLEDDEAVGLFTHEIPHTQSAVLLTSRRAIPGIRTFNVPGFDAGEAEEFIKSRIRLYGLNTTAFSVSVVRDIARITDGSPLYMDDLLRLAKIVDVSTAIKMWSEKGGDEARKYALQREIDKLSTDGRRVLVAAAVTDAPISFPELEYILEFSEERLFSALSELQTLFLFPKAPAVEGEQRYQINLNTKKLVRLVEGTSEFYARIDNRSKALAGKLPSIDHGILGSLIRQAILRLNAEQHAEAETILLGAIDKYPNAPDLHGVLGYVYKRIGRIADARTQFEAAFKLKATSSEMYLHWQKMEIGEKEWSKALAVADRALKIIPDAYEIVERKVYSLRQAGFDLHRGLHGEKAWKMWTDAVEEVKRRIKAPEILPAGARALNASMYQSIVICLDMLNQIRERNHWLERWEKEHPDDLQIASQKEFLVRKRGTLMLG
jgi:tetratricopeptide (TPR) repeat protein